MEARGTIVAAAGLIITVQLALFAGLKADIGRLSDQTRIDIRSVRTDVADLAERVARVEREVAFVKGRLSLALPALARQPDPGPNA